MATSFWAQFFSDIALTQIKDSCDTMVLCSEQPTSYYEATTTFKLGQVAISSSDFTGPLDGVVSGRRLILAAKQITTPTAAGTGKYLALVDTVSGYVRHVKPCTPVTVILSTVVQLDQYMIEIRDP